MKDQESAWIALIIVSLILGTIIGSLLPAQFHLRDGSTVLEYGDTFLVEAVVGADPRAVLPLTCTYEQMPRCVIRDLTQNSMRTLVVTGSGR